MYSLLTSYILLYENECRMVGMNPIYLLTAYYEKKNFLIHILDDLLSISSSAGPAGEARLRAELWVE
mgnify:CR=1 FL=1